jgi:hypothetical protein
MTPVELLIRILASQQVNLSLTAGMFIGNCGRRKMKALLQVLVSLSFCKTDSYTMCSYYVTCTVNHSALRKNRKPVKMAARRSLPVACGLRRNRLINLIYLFIWIILTTL